ncbi:MAG: hypothetical protein J6Y30_03395 [Treponema sp.]|nr:hypothetical protein [Treponema sp.]
MRGSGRASVAKNCNCVKCGKFIEKNAYAYFIYKDETRKQKIAGPFCSEDCAPDVESEEIEKLEKANSGAPIPLRILATIWYIVIGGIFGGFFASLMFKEAEAIHGGFLGKICAFLFCEKQSYLHIWNFNYK